MHDDALLKAKMRWVQLIEQLGRAPATDLLGVVGASGTGGGSVPGDATWTLSFELTVWRIEGADIQTRPLRAHRQVSQPELRQYMKELAPYTVPHAGPGSL